jgi:hypothetical protein
MMEMVVMAATLLIRIKKYLLIFFVPSALFCQDFGYFRPPDNWNCANPKSLSESVEIGFFTKGKKGFAPSINLAKEDGAQSLKEYLKCVKDIHTSDPNISWRLLGDFHSKAGKGALCEIIMKNQWGKIRMLQYVVVKNNRAYVLTGASHTDEFSSLRKQFLNSFRSFTITNDLLSKLPANINEKITKALVPLNNKLSPKKLEKKWKKIQNSVVHETQELGPHFQFLLLKKLYQEKIAPLKEKKD